MSNDINKTKYGRSWTKLDKCPGFLKKAEEVLKARFPERNFYWSILKMYAGGLPQVLTIISDIEIQQ